MRIINRLSFLLIAFLLAYNSAYSQTQADVRMGEILNNGDLFQLRKEYPNLRDSVSIKMLNLIADAQLGIGFNKPESAAVALVYPVSLTDVRHIFIHIHGFDIDGTGVYHNLRCGR